jgi:hypothetical protein
VDRLHQPSAAYAVNRIITLREGLIPTFPAARIEIALFRLPGVQHLQAGEAVRRWQTSQAGQRGGPHAQAAQGWHRWEAREACQGVALQVQHGAAPTVAQAGGNNWEVQHGAAPKVAQAGGNNWEVQHGAAPKVAQAGGNNWEGVQRGAL